MGTNDVVSSLQQTRKTVIERLKSLRSEADRLSSHLHALDEMIKDFSNGTRVSSPPRKRAGKRGKRGRKNGVTESVRRFIDSSDRAVRATEIQTHLEGLRERGELESTAKLRYATWSAIRSFLKSGYIRKVEIDENHVAFQRAKNDTA